MLQEEVSPLAKKDARSTDAEVRRAVARADSLPRRNPDMDKRRRAKTVLPHNPTKAQLARYLKSPNRMDIEGYDTPPTKHPKTEKKAPENPKAAEAAAGKPVRMKARKPRTRDSMDYSPGWYERLPWEDDPEKALRLALEADEAAKFGYHEDMTAALDDDDYREISNSNLYRMDKREAVRAFNRRAWEEYRMREADVIAYRKMKKRGKRR